MIDPKVLLGLPIKFQDICELHSPKISDMVSNDNYAIYQKILTMSQEEIYDSLYPTEKHNDSEFVIPSFNEQQTQEQHRVTDVHTPLEYLLINCYNNRAFLQLTCEAFQFFTHSEILPMYDIKAIYIGDLDKITTYKSLDDLPKLDEDNFLEFQNAIRTLLGMDTVEKPNPDEDPRITKMKAKARYRDKIKAKGGASLNLSSMLIAICCMGIGITPLNIGELSYATVSSLFAMYQNKEKYELDTSCLLAGADSKKIKPKYWISNLN